MTLSSRAEGAEGEQPALPPRFAGVLTFASNAAGSRWSVGNAGMRAAWLDESSGMLWGEREPVELVAGGLDQEQMVQAVRHCSSIEPRGYWSLPTDSEFAQARAADISEHVPNMQGRWLAQLILPNAVLPSIAGFGQGDDTIVSVRCVARGARAAVGSSSAR
jgi:hypothetical protein